MAQSKKTNITPITKVDKNSIDFYNRFISDKATKKEFDKFLLEKFYNKDVVRKLNKKILIIEFFKFYGYRGIEQSKEFIAKQMGIDFERISNLGPVTTFGYISGYSDAKGLDNKLKKILANIRNLKISDPNEQELFRLVYEEIEREYKIAKPNNYRIFKKFNDKLKLVESNLIFEKRFTNPLYSPLYNRYNQYRNRRNKKKK